MQKMLVKKYVKTLIFKKKLSYVHIKKIILVKTNCQQKLSPS